MDNYPPAPPPFASQPPPRRRMSCFAKGCIAVITILLLLAALGVALLYFAFIKTRDAFTSDHPRDVHVNEATDAQYADLSARLRAFQVALNQHQPATLKLDAADLNTIIAKDPAYKALRGKVFFSIDGDDISVETSLRLDSLPLVGGILAGRYFNGKLVWEITFANHESHFQPVEIESNGYVFDEKTIKPILTPQALDRLNVILRNQIAQDSNIGTVARKIDSLVVHDGHIIITSAGGAEAPGVAP